MTDFQVLEQRLDTIQVDLDAAYSDIDILQAQGKTVPMTVDVLKIKDEKGNEEYIRVEEWPMGYGYMAEPEHIRIKKEDFEKIKRLLKRSSQALR